MKSTRSAENKIKTARLAAGMTQAEMSEKYGIPADTIKSWDRGKAYPSLWVEALLLDKLREESLIRKKLVSMYGNLDQFPTYDVVTASGADVKSVTIIENDKCTDENGFFLYALADDEKLYKAYYNAADHDLSKPLIMIDITGDFIKRKKPHDSAELEEYCKGIIYSTGGDLNMKKFKIYRNYGCLSAEKRVKYTYGTEAATAVASDELIVSLPEKSKGWEVYETAAGGLAVESPWGMQYDINEVLAGDKEPQFRTWDNDGVRYITLKVWED